MTRCKDAPRPADPYAVLPEEHPMCQEHVSSVCSVCRFLKVRKDGQRRTIMTSVDAMFYWAMGVNAIVWIPAILMFAGVL